MVSQISMAQSGSCQALLRMRAACSVVGGCGFGVSDGVSGEPAPPHSPFQGTAEYEVDVPDAAVRQRPALVRLAALIALVRAGGTVVDARLPVAVVPATPERGVEGIEQVTVERFDLQRADQRPDVLSGQVAVVRERVLLQLGELEVPIE
jgi:hypothetical protein